MISSWGSPKRYDNVAAEKRRKCVRYCEGPIHTPKLALPTPFLRWKSAISCYAIGLGPSVCPAHHLHSYNSRCSYNWWTVWVLKGYNQHGVVWHVNIGSARPGLTTLSNTTEINYSNKTFRHHSNISGICAGIISGYDSNCPLQSCYVIAPT